MYKLAVVDDEAIVRKGILNLIPWDSLDCQIVCEASDGQQLLEKLDYCNPDIVITDVKMPRMDGLELCKHLHQQKPDIQLIMLTAYSDFEYARQGMKYGVIEYVTKSGGMKEVTDAVKHAIERLEEHRLLVARQQVQEKSLDSLRITFFKNVFYGELNDAETVCSRAAHLGITLDEYVVASIEIVFDTATNPQPEPRCEPMEDFLCLAFQEYGFWCVPLRKKAFCTVISTKGKKLPFDQIVSKYEQVLKVLSNMYAGTVFIGISSVHQGAQALSQAYTQAIESLGRRFMDDTSRIYLYQDKSRLVANGVTVVDEAVEQLCGTLQEGNEARTAQMLDNLFLLQKENNIPAEMLKSQALLINAQCGRLLAEHQLQIENIYEHEVRYFQRITSCRSLQEYKSIVRPLVLSTCRQLHQLDTGASDFVHLATQYIQEHYCEGITLEDVAQAIHVSPSHLARVYKDATGHTVKSDINNLRLKKAKEVLCNPYASVQAAADAIGMDDITYFSHFFKKYTGVSPKHYQLHGDKS